MCGGFRNGGPERYSPTETRRGTQPMSATAVSMIGPTGEATNANPAGVVDGRGGGRALVIDALHKRFGETVVLAGIDVDMAPGEFLVLVGPSGCGKSTLLNCIAGLEEVSDGRLEIAGRDVTDVPPRERDIAMVFQSYALYPTMSVADNIGFGMRVRRVPKPTIRRRVAEVAELLQIGHPLERRPAELSGGQRQRVAMGRALVRDPALFLFDEPLSNLDAKLRVEMRAEIKRVHESTGASIVYVTHDQIEAMTLATRIVVLKGGVVQQIACPETIYERPANTFVADFMGSPPMNLVPATPRDDARALAFDDGRTLDVTSPDAVRGLARVVVGIRPEAFARASGGRAANGRAANENVEARTATSTLEIVPTLVENAGADAWVTFELGGRPVTARLAGRFTGAPGQPATLSLDTSALCLFTDDPDGGGRLLHPPPRAVA